MLLTGRNILTPLATVASLAGMIALSGPAAAQAQPAPAAAPAQTWNSTVSKDPQGGAVLDAAQVEALKKISLYFNDLKQMKGNFVQLGADNKRMRGKFFIKQPGKFRFEYGFGSKQLIVSDGTYLSVQDLDINTRDTVELDRTPFRMLLRKDVDFLRDANVLEVQEVEDLIIVALADKSPDAPGKIRLFLSKKPALELKEWVTTDAQGGDTRIEISEINKTEDIAADLFKPAQQQLPKSTQ